ncbi:lipoyl synthase, partial [Desulforhopalus singaporensis]
KALFVERFCRRFSSEAYHHPKHPDWLKLQAPRTTSVEKMESILQNFNVETVCKSAHCPNIGECFANGTATFMILGTRCTRNCRFCAVENGQPVPPDPEEPLRLAEAVKRLNLKYVVVTSVTRDDLDDGGASQFVDTIQAVRTICPGTKLEILTPDFKGSSMPLQMVCDARPDMFNHNIETVPRLYSRVRPQAIFDRSLRVLSFAAEQGLKVKSGMMLGLGESEIEVEETLASLLKTGCRYLTLGQYLAPSKMHEPVARYVQPHEFQKWADKAKTMGFKEVASGPLIRSSYKAEQMVA